MDKEQTLRVIVIEESQNDAEALANILRNAGQALRSTHVEDDEDLQQALDAQAPDLILCASGIEGLGPDVVRSNLDQRELDIPLIVVGESADEAAVVAALQTGATDLVSFDQPEHLQLVVARELTNLRRQRELQHHQQALKESERRCRSLLDSSRDAITYIHDGMHIYANRSYLEMFGFDDLEEIGGTPIMDMVAKEDHGRFKEFLRSYGKPGHDADTLEIRGLHPDGKAFNAVMEFAPASIDGEPCTQIVIRDQSISRELEQKLKYLSKQDLVTGLYNRQYFMEELELAVTNTVSGGGAGGVLYVLLDNFKTVKENVGLAASDLVISDAAKLIQDRTGDRGVAARFGDNAFTVLLGGAEPDELQTLADGIRGAVEEHICDVEGRSVTITCSVGISLITESAPEANEILSRADLACEVARSAGGNRVHLHNPVADERMGKEREQQWHHLIRDALAEQRFHLVYQPIVSLGGSNSEKYEVLLRMVDGQGEDILPGQFIAVAEQTGQIADIDRWVITNAINTLAQRRQQGQDTAFFVKIAGASLDDHELPLWINEQLKAARLGGDCLVLEIAEKVAVDHLKNAKAFVKAVQALQCKTALEHFGSGPNSFQLLKHLPVDYLKIDGSFIHNLTNDTDNQAMVKSIVDMAHSMNKAAIAEFVEDAQSLAVLWQYEVDFIQGYFLQEPDEELSYDFSEETV